MTFLIGCVHFEPQILSTSGQCYVFLVPELLHFDRKSLLPKLLSGLSLSIGVEILGGEAEVG